MFAGIEVPGVVRYWSDAYTEGLVLGTYDSILNSFVKSKDFGGVWAKTEIKRKKETITFWWNEDDNNADRAKQKIKEIGRKCSRKETANLMMRE